MLKTFLAASLLLVYLFLSPNNTQATTPEVTPNDTEKKTCEETRTKVNSLIDEWKKSEPDRKKKYSNSVVKIQKQIKELEDQGLDTESAKNGLQSLVDAITKRNSDTQILINLLSDTRLYICVVPESQFNDSMAKVSKQWTVYREDTLEIRNIWQNQVRPKLRELKERGTNLQ